MATKVIGLWLDRTSDPGRSAWIVSRDRMNARGEAETTTTVGVFDADGDGARGRALEYALGLARGEGLPLIRTGTDGPCECLFDPRADDDGGIEKDEK